MVTRFIAGVALAATVTALCIAPARAQAKSAIHQPAIVVTRLITTVDVTHGDFSGAQRQALSKLQEEAILSAALERSPRDPEAQDRARAVVRAELPDIVRALPAPKLVAARPDPAAARMEVEADVTVDVKSVSSRLRQRECMEDWQVAVDIPEFVLNIPPPPDPAVYTEVNRQLAGAKFTCIDRAAKQDAMQRELDLMRHIMGANQPPLPPQTVSYMLGADILVKGEAFAEIRRTREDAWYCEARVEYQAVFVDTGQIISSDAVSVNRAGGSPGVLAKDTLQAAAEKVSHYLVQDLLCLPVPDERRVRVAMYNLKSARDLLAVEALVKKIDGVTSVRRQRYSIGIAEYVVTVRAEDVEAFPLSFVGDDLVAKLELEPVAFSKVNVTLVKTET